MILILVITVMGSRAGSSNRNKQFLLKRLQDMYGDDFHPIMNMAAAAYKMQQLIDQKSKDDVALLDYKTLIESWDKVAQYTEPKLKAIEQTGTVKVEHATSLSDEQLLAIAIRGGEGTVEETQSQNTTH